MTDQTSEAKQNQASQKIPEGTVPPDVGVMAANETPDKEKNPEATNNKSADFLESVRRVLKLPRGWWDDLRRPEVSNRTIAVATVFVAVATVFTWIEVHMGSKQTDKIVAASESIQGALDTQNLQGRDALDQTLRENRRGLRRNLRQSEAAMDASNGQSRLVLNASISAARIEQRAWVAATGISGVPEADKTLDIVVTAKNTGKTFAKKFKMVVDAEAVITGNQPRYEQELTEQPASISLLAPNGDYVSKTRLSTKTNNLVIKSDIDGIQAGVFTLVVHGRLTYDDIFTRPIGPLFASNLIRA